MLNSSDADKINKMAHVRVMAAKNDFANQISAQCHTTLESKENLFHSTNLVFGIHTVFSFIFKNSAMIFLSLTILFILYALYKSYLNPIKYVKELTEIGYSHIPRGPDRALHIARIQNAKQLGKKVPPPYPNGWYTVAESRDLTIKKVLAVDALGLNLCVYRGEDGVARCVDAYCPHLGANLGVGGTVCGNCIECPFHHWKFGSNGDCVSVPGNDTVPKGVSIKTWKTMELDGAVWIWYDAEGRDPLWTVPEAPELKNWAFRGMNDFLINAHIQEIPENGADVTHLNAIHSTSYFSSLGEKFPILHNIIGHHHWYGEWSRDKEDHIASIKIKQSYMIMKFDAFPVKVDVKQIGPSHVRLRFESPLGPLMITQSVTPLAPLLQRVVHRVYSPAYNAPLGAWMVIAEALQFQRDVAIWNSKRYESSPAYVKSDKTIRAFRSWFMQFYSEHSISLRQALQHPLDW